MADHSNYPKAISKHHTPESELTYGTIGSVVIDASDRVLWAWSGNPCGGYGARSVCSGSRGDRHGRGGD